MVELMPGKKLSIVAMDSLAVLRMGTKHFCAVTIDMFLSLSSGLLSL
jgi:hypothetical protein